MYQYTVDPDHDLADDRVLGKLIRNFVKEILVDEESHHDDAEYMALVTDEKAHHLAKTLLSKDPAYKGPPWFSPGQIDDWVARQEGCPYADPEERIAGALRHLMVKLLRLVETQHLDWQKVTDGLLNHYTALMMGIPTNV